MDSKKIVVIARSPSPNTTEIYDGLSIRDEFDVEVLYLVSNNRKWGKLAFDVSHECAELRNYNIFSQKPQFALCPGVLKYIFDENNDFILIQGYATITSFVSLFFVQFRRGKWLFWSERVRKPNKKYSLESLLKRIIMMLVNRADWIFVVGSAAAAANTYFGLRTDRTSALPYLKNLASYHRVYEQSESTRYLYKSIVCTARLVPLKRVALLIEIFGEVSKDFPGWRLDIIGEGESMEKCLEAAKAVSDGEVRFHGFVDYSGQQECYRKASIFAFPSRQDGWGMVIPEAMAAGLPVLATDGAIAARDLIIEGQNGFMTPVEDRSAFREKLKYLVANPNVRGKMGANAYSTSKERCDVTGHIARVAVTLAG